MVTGGPEGSTTPEELELLELDEAPLELDELEELEELELLELDELALLAPPSPLEPLLPPQAVKAANNTSEALTLAAPVRRTDEDKRFIKHIPMLCDVLFETTITLSEIRRRKFPTAKSTPAVPQMRCCYP